MLKLIKEYFDHPQNLQNVVLTNKNSLLLVKTHLENSDIGMDSALLSCDSLNVQVLKILEKILKLTVFETSSKIIPNAAHWSMTQDSKEAILTKIATEIMEKVRPTIAQKMIYCSEELISNAIYALYPKLKAKAAKLIEQKSIDVFINLDSEVKVLVVKDHYGAITKTAKSQILSNITKEVVSPRSNRDEGGAGIGLNLVREFCDFLVIRHLAGEWTESYCFFFKQQSNKAPFLFLEAE